jgi:hypothetical protein
VARKGSLRARKPHRGLGASKWPKTPILRFALCYADKLGWCVIPIPHGRKKAVIGWKRFQTERPDREQLQKWFGRGQHNIAVMVGAVSGGLTCRDFDLAESYTAWAKAHPDLAALLPTVRTVKGYHVYFLASVEGIHDLGDGELRGSRGYCMLPPSVHPDGPMYEWIIRPIVENLLVLDPERAGFLSNGDLVTEQTENTEKPEQTEHTEAIEWGEVVERIIGETLPREFGTRNRRVFDLARTLKSLPQFADADPRDLRAIVQEWHRRALPKIRTKEFEETWIDFLKAWPGIKYVKGTEPMMQTFQRAVESERPRVAVTKYPENQRLQILVALCRELQRAAGGQPFYLSCRTAGRLFSVSHTEAARWFFLLESDGILRVVTKGGTHEDPRNATRFRYLGD